MVSRALVGLLFLAITFAFPAAAQSSQRQSCSAHSEEFRYHAKDTLFSKIAADISLRFAPGPTVRMGVPAASIPSGPIIPAGTEVITILTETVACATRNTRSKKTSDATFSASSCDYVGCVESLGPDYNHLGPGSTVSISTCGENVSTTRTYTRGTNGNWVMTSYRTEYVTQCNPV